MMHLDAGPESPRTRQGCSQLKVRILILNIFRSSASVLGERIAARCMRGACNACIDGPKHNCVHASRGVTAQVPTRMIMFELTSIFGGAISNLRQLPRLRTSTYLISMIVHACLCQAQVATASTAAFTDVHQHEPCHSCGTTAAPFWRPADLSGE
jgi:hypothetical protein